jgi:hypothetical protein
LAGSKQNSFFQRQENKGLAVIRELKPGVLG